MSPLRHNTVWIRDVRNPVLPPQDPGFDSRLCMNPWVVRDGDEYQLYYAGEGEDDRRRICLATAPVDDVTDWTRHGPQFDRGEHGDFDGAWCVLPHVVDVDADHRRIYYTGNSGIGRSLDRFPGLGFAESVNGGPYRKHPDNPVIPPSRRAGDPDALGMAGGSVIRIPGNTPEWRFYYTGCPTVGDDVFLDQQKTVCLATSADGITWHKQGAVMLRDPDRDYEDIAVAGPSVRRHPSGIYQMWYSAIGTRWGYYSICYAESEDGITWTRGDHYGDNLQLGPATRSMPTWESQMVEYPTVVDEDPGLRLFYTGNGYGRGGIGTAISSPLRATALPDGRLRITAAHSGEEWVLRSTATLDGTTGKLDATTGGSGAIQWHGPDADLTLWSREQPDQQPGQQATIRHTVRHTTDGIDIRTMIDNDSDRERSVCAGLVVDTGDPSGVTFDPPPTLQVAPRTAVEFVTSFATRPR